MQEYQARPRQRSPSRRSIDSGNSPRRWLSWFPVASFSFQLVGLLATGDWLLGTSLKRNIVVGELGAGLDHVLFRRSRARGCWRPPPPPIPSEQDDAIAADLGGVALVAVLVVPLAVCRRPST